MEILDYALRTGLLIFLGAAAEMDLKSRRINFIFLCVSFTLGFAAHAVSGDLSLKALALGALTGGMLALVSALSRQAIGYGDSFMAAVCGVWLGFYNNILLLLISFLIMTAFVIPALVLKKVKPKDSLPFAPFLLAGYVAMLAAGF